MHTYFKEMGIEYAGNQSSKNIRVLSDDEFFVENSTKSNHAIKNRILQYGLIPYKCSHCDVKDTWNGIPIKLHLDHINGDNRDNRLDNLRFLCPNCHSQTDTYCGKAVNNNKQKVSDKALIEALNKHDNIRKALMSVGLSPKGGNYNRCYKLRSRDPLGAIP
jgi:Zn finger protein HypA/HybF involved in hydrogenase expression